jgi:hypothetical protein
MQLTDPKCLGDSLIRLHSAPDWDSIYFYKTLESSSAEGYIAKDYHLDLLRLKCPKEL